MVDGAQPARLMWTLLEPVIAGLECGGRVSAADVELPAAAGVAP